MLQSMRAVFLAFGLTAGFAHADELGELKFFEKCWDNIGRLEQSIPLGQMGQREIKIRRQIDGLLNSCGERQKAFAAKFGYEPDCKTNESFITTCKKPDPNEVAKRKAAAKKAEADALARETAAEKNQLAEREQEKKKRAKEAKEKDEREALWK